jgi:hypothetical protein
MVNTLLHLAFAITGRRAFSDMIAHRRATARWNARVAAHKRSGGYVVTIDGPRHHETRLV